jgi:hypothetical protein
VGYKKQLARERKEMNIQGREDRQREKARRSKVKELKYAKQPIPPELAEPIVDREKVWKAEQEAIKQQKDLQAKLATDQKEDQEEEEEEEVTFIIDTEGDPTWGVQSREWDEGYIPLIPEGPLTPKIWWKEKETSSDESSGESSSKESSEDSGSEKSSGESSSDYDSDEFVDTGPSFGQRFAR